jgi:O-methyltransferase
MYRTSNQHYTVKKLIQSIISRTGYNIINERKRWEDIFSTPNVEYIYKAVRHYTMTNPERIYALIQSVDFVVSKSVSGAFVECGVWKGGSVMALLLRLQQIQANNREIFLFDLFANPDLQGHSYWLGVPLDEVQNNVASINYSSNLITFVSGDIATTSKQPNPENIAILRLDMDEYHPTKHALENFYPRMSPGGVIIIDDYGSHPEGAKLATDEFLETLPSSVFLHRVDQGARVFIKP